jgi:hypothetical protein
MRRRKVRRAVTALLAAGTATIAVTGTAHAYLPDPVKLTDPEIDFGDSVWVGLLNDPLGTGSVNWSIDSGYYTPTLVGTLHLNNARHKWGRMHIDYYDGAGGYIDTEHSTPHESPEGVITSGRSTSSRPRCARSCRSTCARRSATTDPAGARSTAPGAS